MTQNVTDFLYLSAIVQFQRGGGGSSLKKDVQRGINRNHKLVTIPEKLRKLIMYFKM